ncbi:M20/M25/M40 family metallo-hydrolase [Pendulispora brunnea]|uniref:M20/M25/M40 family metallo-hydrolase n=1 Tax=Pendulispora brunnea TaxID=2905690 RepID=A0ABZ2JYF9_9BACT
MIFRYPIWAVAFLVACSNQGGAAPESTKDDTGSQHGRRETEAPPVASPFGLARTVDQARYTADVATIAKERTPNNPQWQSVQDLCATRFEQYGFTVERRHYATGTNVVGVKTGTSEQDKAHQIIVGAHYDSVANCPGADDNASGVAGTLEAARVLSSASFPRTLTLTCWDEEETGYKGSTATAKQSTQNHDIIDAVFDFEMIAFKSDAENSQTFPVGIELVAPLQAQWLKANKNRGNFIATFGNPGTEHALEVFSVYAQKVGVPNLATGLTPLGMLNPLLGDLRRSDHGPYWTEGYPAVMVTDTANFRNPAYHCLNGTVDDTSRLNFEFATQVVKSVVAASAEMLGLPRDI